MFNLFIGDCRKQMLSLDKNSVDSIVTDPPYELGFMGKKWDGSGIAYDPEVWCQALRVLKPGGHLLAFGGTRTWHRMVVAIEDAGFEIRDSLMWLYGSGFPKSLDVRKAILKGGDLGTSSKWEGWGTALKPAWEPIILARKPLVGTVAKNVLEHGTGALNIDASRVEGKPWSFSHSEKTSRSAGIMGTVTGARAGTAESHPAGRWPANLILDPEAGALLDEQSGTRKSGSRKPGTYAGLGYQGSESADFPAVEGSEGGASRFFYCAKASKKDRNYGLPEGAKNDHPTVKPSSLMRYLVRLITPPGGIVLDPFMGSGSTGIAAILDGFRFIGIDQDEHYVNDIAVHRLNEAKNERLAG